MVHVVGVVSGLIKKVHVNAVFSRLLLEIEFISDDFIKIYV